MGILDDTQKAEIAKQIQEGFYRGVFCADGWNCSWKLSVRVWNDEDTAPSLESNIEDETGGNIDPVQFFKNRIRDYSYPPTGTEKQKRRR